jgi:hypothetical protein
MVDNPASSEIRLDNAVLDNALLDNALLDKREVAVVTDASGDRYGRAVPRRRRRALVAGIAVVVLAAIAWFAWAAWSGRESATGTEIGFQVVDDGTVRLTFDVDKPEDATATCTIQALDSGFSVVGTVDVRVGPAPQTSVRQTATIRTTNRATAGRVVSCSVVH